MNGAGGRCDACCGGGCLHGRVGGELYGGGAFFGGGGLYGGGAFFGVGAFVGGGCCCGNTVGMLLMLLCSWWPLYVLSVPLEVGGCDFACIVC